MEAHALEQSIFFTVMTFIGIMGARWIIRESLYKAYCRCEHEFNEHWVKARGHSYTLEWPTVEKCKKCSCQAYKKNEKDPRNSLPVRFW